MVVQQNRDSGDFQNDEANTTVTVIAASSAEDGDRGPGPFIGDMAGFSGSDFGFERRR